MALPTYSTMRTPGYKPITPVASTTSTGTSGFNANPAPHGGVSPYGSVPGSVALPNPAGDLGAVYPNLTGANEQLSKNIMSELRGQLSPETLSSIQDASATYGVNSGMPGSGLAVNRNLRDLGVASQQLQGQGLSDYLNAITGISKTQTVDPALQVSTAQQNSVWNSAPDPEAAAKEQQRLFDKYLASTKAPSGGTGSYAPAGGGTTVNGWSQDSLTGQLMGAFSRNKWA